MLNLKKETRLKIAILLAFAFVVVEFIGGVLANSLAIYSDAAHLLSDVAGFMIALISLTATQLPGSKNFTYGLVRMEIFGAILSIFCLWAITVWLVIEALFRAVDWFEGTAKPMNGKLMFFVALFGIIVNVVLASVFSEEHGHSLGHHHDHGHDHNDITESCDDDHDIEIGKIRSHDHSHAHAESSSPSVLPGEEVGTERSSLLVTSSHIQKYDESHLSHHNNLISHEHKHDHDHSHHTGESGEDAEHSSIAATTPHTHSRDVNLEAAYLHVITDLIQSIGVAIAGLIIWMFPDYQVVDPICTLVFSILVMWSTFPLVRKVLVILMEGKPEHVDWEELERKLNEIDGVVDVHDLHVWSLASSHIAMTVHIKGHNPQAILKAAHKVCAHAGINHATIQVQDAADPDSPACLSQCTVSTREDGTAFTCVTQTDQFGF